MPSVTQKFIPGPRLIDGTDLNNLVEQINAALSGAQTPSSVTTGALSASGVVTLSALPTEDPGVAGELYNDTGAVKVSAGS